MELDLSPPPFSDGLYDWSCGNGTPDEPTCAELPNARLVRDDPDFGICLEIQKSGDVQQLRYMGEIPYRRGSYIRISARVKVMRGTLCPARISAWPGGMGGKGVGGLNVTAPLHTFKAHNRQLLLTAVIGPEDFDGVDMVWDDRVLYTHAGIDLVGAFACVARIGNVEVEDATRAITSIPRIMPGFTAADVIA